MIEVVSVADDALVEAWARLMPQLSETATPPDRAWLTALLQTATMLVARDEGDAIVGALCLTIYRIPTGLQARIDDVVVDAASRGRGLGEALSKAAIERARQAGAASVHLTSHPTREAANRLYVRLGFAQRDTNIYRLLLTPSPSPR